jgi:amino acid permease
VIVGIGISVDDIEVVFNIIGAVCSTSIGALFPCFFYFKLVDKKRKTKRLLYYITIFVFMVMLPFAIFSVVAKYV